MNKKVLLYLFIVVAGKLFAQQVPMYNHILFNPFVYNPALAGANGDVNAFLVRNQRYGSFSSVSINNYLTIDGAFAQKKAGYGVQLSNQTHGLQQQFASSLSYSYRLMINDEQTVRFGVNVGILDNRIDTKSINVEQTDDPYLISLRPSTISFDMNAGLSYQWKSFTAGLAVPQLIGNKVTFDKENSRGYYRLARHIMFTSSYDFPLTQSGNWILKPYAVVRYVPHAPIQYDVMVQLNRSKIGWFAVGYKSGYSLQFNLGFNLLKQFKVGYSYEYVIGSMKNYSSGIHHELMIGLTFGGKEKEIIRVEDHSSDVVNDSIREQLEARNKELEDILIKTLAEKELIKEQQNELIAQNEQLIKENETLTDIKNDSLSDKTEVTVPKTPLEKIPYAKGYRFIDLDLGDSPDGFYVITGVFSSRKNADMALAKSLKDYSQSYLVINQKNGFYYVVILYSLDQEEATKVFKKYKRSTKKDAWILNYKLTE